MAPQMKSPVVSGLQKDLSLRGLATQREGLSFHQQLRVYNSYQAWHEPRGCENNVRDPGSCGVLQTMPTAGGTKKGIKFHKQRESADGVEITHPVGLREKHRMQPTPVCPSTLSHGARQATKLSAPVDGLS